MELDDLKTTWKSLENDLELLPVEVVEEVKDRKDAKESLTRRFVVEIFFMAIGCVGIASSRLWAPLKMPIWWITAFCILFVAASVATVFMIKKLNQLSLGDSSPAQVLTTLLSIKKFYRNVELYSCIVIAALMMYNAFIVHTTDNLLDMALVIAIIILCFILELSWYRTNIRKFNEMQKWIE